MFAQASLDFPWSIAFSFIGGALGSGGAVGWWTSRAKLSIEAKLAALQQIAVNQEQSRISHDFVSATIARNRELKKECYFEMISVVEEALMKLARFTELSKDEMLSLISVKLAQRIMQVHLVASPALSAECLVYGKWLLETIPPMVKTSLEIQEAGKTKNVEFEISNFHSNLVTKIIECRRIGLAVIREMRKELNIDAPGDWAAYEAVWEKFLRELVPSKNI